MGSSKCVVMSHFTQNPVHNKFDSEKSVGFWGGGGGKRDDFFRNGLMRIILNVVF